MQIADLQRENVALKTTAVVECRPLTQQDVTLQNNSVGAARQTFPFDRRSNNAPSPREQQMSSQGMPPTLADESAAVRVSQVLG